MDFTEAMAVFVNLLAFYNRPVICDSLRRIILGGHGSLKTIGL